MVKVLAKMTTTDEWLTFINYITNIKLAWLETEMLNNVKLNLPLFRVRLCSLFEAQQIRNANKDSKCQEAGEDI